MRVLLEDKKMISFGDADAQGILYFARTFDYAHECLERFWNQSSLGWNFWFQNPEFAVPLRHSSCDHLRPLKAGVTYTTQLSVVDLGQSSVKFAFEVRDADSVCARVETVHVFVDRKSFKKIDVPEKIRTQFSSSGPLS